MGPVSSSPLQVTVIDNRPSLAIICQRQSINHFQRKHRRERSFKWGRFHLDNCNYVQQISPRIPRCLHSLKWKRLPFLWLTVGILQIWGFVFIAAVMNRHSGWHPLQDGRRILQNWACLCVCGWMTDVCQRVELYLQTWHLSNSKFTVVSV